MIYREANNKEKWMGKNNFYDNYNLVYSDTIENYSVAFCIYLPLFVEGIEMMEGRGVGPAMACRSSFMRCECAAWNGIQVLRT